MMAFFTVLAVWGLLHVGYQVGKNQSTTEVFEVKNREIPKAAYDITKQKCVLIYPDTIFYKECKKW